MWNCIICVYICSSLNSWFCIFTWTVLKYCVHVCFSIFMKNVCQINIKYDIPFCTLVLKLSLLVLIFHSIHCSCSDSRLQYCYDNCPVDYINLLQKRMQLLVSDHISWLLEGKLLRRVWQTNCTQLTCSAAIKWQWTSHVNMELSFQSVDILCIMTGYIKGAVMLSVQMEVTSEAW